MRPLKPLWRCNTLLASSPDTRSQLPGAYVRAVLRRSRFPNVEGGCILQLIAPALYVGRLVPLGGAEERNAKAEATRRCAAVEQAEYARLFEEDLR